MEEVGAAFGLEADAEGLFQGRAHRLERRGVAGRFDTRQAITGVGGEQPGQVSRLGERRAVRQGTGKIFAQAGADVAGEGARSIQLAVEVAGAVGQPEGFELRRAARRVLAHQDEIARVGHQNQAVTVPIAADLIAGRREPGIVLRALHLDHAALRRLPRARLALLHLLRRVQPEVRVPGPLVGKLADAEHLGLERRADGVEQIGERPGSSTARRWRRPRRGPVRDR